MPNYIVLSGGYGLPYDQGEIIAVYTDQQTAITHAESLLPAFTFVTASESDTPQADDLIVFKNWKEVIYSDLPTLPPHPQLEDLPLVISEMLSLGFLQFPYGNHYPADLAAYFTSLDFSNLGAKPLPIKIYLEPKGEQPTSQLDYDGTTLYIAITLPITM